MILKNKQRWKEQKRNKAICILFFYVFATGKKLLTVMIPTREITSETLVKATARRTTYTFHSSVALSTTRIDFKIFYLRVLYFASSCIQKRHRI